MNSSFRKWIPYWLKNILRAIRYPEERSRIRREWSIRREQERNIATLDQDATSLIIFLVPGADRITGKETISGGVISLVSLCEETSKLRGIHQSTVLMCTFPREFLLVRHCNFENDTNIYRFDQIHRYFKSAKRILIHIPEFQVPHFTQSLFPAEIKWLKGLEFVHLNIINANILLMPSPDIIQRLETLASKITITAAHSKYCTPHFRNLYGYPLHKFSAWISPEQYERVPYESKEDIMVVSPDVNIHRELVLQILSRRNDLNIITLQNLSYTKFKEVVGRAKWALTFGEGLDGYILEPIFSGAIGFAVYNEDFFTDDFRSMGGIYLSYEEMAKKIIQDIEKLDSEEIFPSFQMKQFELCAMHYNSDQYKRNIREFYRGNYTHP